MNLRGTIILLLALTAGNLLAGVTDTIALKQVEAIGVRFGKYTLGSRVLKIDSLSLVSYKSGSIADLLVLHSLASVNSYGPEGLASISLRGGSTRHAAVIWNGFNLRNPASGGLNFSALPAGFFDEVSIQSGGSSTMYGSGASTGVIFLSDKLSFGKERLLSNINLEGGSFGTYSFFGNCGLNRQSFSTQIKISYQHSDNDFRFKNTAKFGDPIENLEHAAYSRFSFAQQNAVKTGKSSKLETDFWYTNLDKQVPALMSDYENGTAVQNDKTLRMAVNYSQSFSNWVLHLRSGFLSDEVKYFDSITLDKTSLNKSYSFINEGEGRIKFRIHHELNLGLNQTIEKAKSGGYVSDTGRSRFSVFGRYNFSPLPEKLNFSFEGRQELVNGARVPFVYSVSGTYKLFYGFIVKTILSKHYSLPVFDDLFWQEDAFAKGNPNLKPEYGYNSEVGISYLIKRKFFMLENEISIYRNKINDLIIWLPDSTGKSTPSNIKNSDTRGIEFTGSIRRIWGAAGLDFKYMYGYTDARIFDSLNDGIGSQRIYVPKHKLNFSLGFSYKTIRLSYSQSFFSERYYDDINVLPFYSLADMQLSYSAQFKSSTFSVYLKIRNLYNTSYQVMSGYAQPLRNYNLGINISL